MTKTQRNNRSQIKNHKRYRTQKGGGKDAARAYELDTDRPEAYYKQCNFAVEEIDSAKKKGKRNMHLIDELKKLEKKYYPGYAAFKKADDEEQDLRDKKYFAENELNSSETRYKRAMKKGVGRVERVEKTKEHNKDISFLTKNVKKATKVWAAKRKKIVTAIRKGKMYHNCYYYAKDKQKQNKTCKVDLKDIITTSDLKLAKDHRFILDNPNSRKKISKCF